MNSENNKALEEIDVNFWITANAGSGKTTQLVKRYILLLKNGIKPEEIVCITYTDAGASTMKTRILATARHEGLTIQESQLRVSTIHSFCKKLLTTNNILPHNVNVLNNDTYALNNIVKKIINRLMMRPELDRLTLENAIIDISKYENLTAFQDIIHNIVQNQLKFFSLFNIIMNEQNITHNILDCTNITELHKLLPATLQKFIGNSYNLNSENQKLANLLKQQDVNVLYKIAEKIVGIKNQTTLSLFRDQNGSLDKNAITQLKNWQYIVLTKDNKPRVNVKKYNLSLLTDIQNYYVSCLRQIGIDISLSMLHLAYFTLYEYQTIKNTLNVVTYDDLLFQTFKLLTQDKLFNHTQNNGSNIKYLMLDEAQDTNPVSWEIIKALIKKLKCYFFIIGDEKQSIYRFQGARIETYETNKQVFKQIANLNQQKYNDSVILNTSYRSIQPILDEADKLCNDVNNKSAFTGKSDTVIKHYTAINMQNHIQNGHILTPTEAIIHEHFIRTQNSQQTTDNKQINNQNNENLWCKRTERLKQAQEFHKQDVENIANIIYKYYLIHQNETKNDLIKDNTANNGMALIYPRSTAYNNIVLDVAAMLRNKYKINVGLNIDNEKCNIYYKDILAFFKFYVLQNDNMNLACLLKSRLFNFNDNMLLQICNSITLSSTNTLWQAMKCNTFDDNELNNKLTFARNVLKQIIACRNLNDLIQTLQSIIDRHIIINPEDVSYTMPLSIIQNVAIKNIDVYNYDIRGFLKYLQSTDDCLLSTNQQDIIFSTIHGVKGEEYNTVILLELKPSHVNKAKMLFFDDCFWYKTSACQIQEDDQYSQSLLQNIQRQAVQEKNELLRLKYVAITRAKRRLIYLVEI